MLSILTKKIKIPKKVSKKQLKEFFEGKGLEKLNILSNTKNLKINQMISDSPYKPELDDLYRIYKFITLNKRTTVLEFGSGWSTLLIHLALNENKKKYQKEVSKLRRNNPFELFTIENEKKFLYLTKKKVTHFTKMNKKNINSKINYFFSKVEMTIYNRRYATQYKKLPLCNPDFIYIDGPDQFNVKKKINNFTTAHKDMMPMICDVLKMEYFLTPGTIIITDGRSANAQFLNENFKRRWIHHYDKSFDQHIFYLNAPSLGIYNKKQLNFYKKKI